MKTLPPRIASLIEVTDTCWIWRGTVRPNGYGRVKHQGVLYLAHRLVYESLIGPIPDGLQLDHLCRVRHCVRPTHLEPVTASENLRRSPIAPAGINARKTHCVHGHEFTEENTYVDREGYRNCRTCRSATARAWEKNNRKAA